MILAHVTQKVPDCPQLYQTAPNGVQILKTSRDLPQHRLQPCVKADGYALEVGSMHSLPGNFFLSYDFPTVLTHTSL